MVDVKYPRFTVIIPQKNRAEYLKWTLKTCMIQDYPNFEIIVSDDCSDDDSVSVVEELMRSDKRIKLFAHKKHLGMRDNFEFALNQVSPGYVMALGGDDGLVPGCIFRMYEILKETGLQLLTWPTAYFMYPKQECDVHNIFMVKRKRFNGVEIRNSKDFLKKIANTFRYQIDECPMFYMKGVASTEIVDRVKSRTPDNCFYYCPTPDGFSGVVLAGEVEKYAYTNEPLSIGGTTTKSQGRNYRRTDKKSREEAQQFFNDNLRRTMHHQLASQPYSPLVTLMTADYLLTAADLPGWPGKCYEISFENLIRRTFQFLEKSYFEEEVLVRELKILKEIATQHDLLPLFNSLSLKTRRRVVKEEQPYGFVITNSIRFDGSQIGIKNIYDASLAVNFVYNCYNRFSCKLFFELIRNSIKVLLRSCHYKVEKLPSIDSE
ncbi:Glycosyl transferase family 2 [Bacteroidales bacterium WCE2008]|nr:Glycosyl transferase family 2 [Bacteroidales bacterium WCE2008]